MKETAVPELKVSFAAGFTTGVHADASAVKSCCGYCISLLALLEDLCSGYCETRAVLNVTTSAEIVSVRH